jgi:hypothetical protein
MSLSEVDVLSASSLDATGRSSILTSCNCLDPADTNEDGTVSLTDIVFLLGYLFKAGNDLPLPNPQCGPDPTGDAARCEENAGRGLRSNARPGKVGNETRRHT